MSNLYPSRAKLSHKPHLEENAELGKARERMQTSEAFQPLERLTFHLQTGTIIEIKVRWKHLPEAHCQSQTECSGMTAGRFRGGFNLDGICYKRDGVHRLTTQPSPSVTGTALDVLEWRARTVPDHLAFSIEGKEISYADLHREVIMISGSLMRLGVRPGNCCGLLLHTSLDFIRALYAVQACAAVPVALNPNLPDDFLQRLVQLAECTLLIATSDRLANLLRARKGTTLQLQLAEIRDLLGTHGPSKPVSVHARSTVPAFYQFTSGTTGEPRAAVISHSSLRAFMEASCERMGITPADILAGYSPLHHNIGLVRFVFCPVYYGCPCHLVQPSIGNLRAWLETIGRVRATITSGSDFAYRAAARLVSPAGVDLRSLRLALSGGEPVRLSTIGLFEERFQVPGVIRPAYGLAEATLGLTSLAPGEPLRVDPSGTVSCGRPLKSMQIKIVDNQGREKKPGEQGLIVAQGPQLFSGYLGDEEASRRVLRDGWLHTGDWGSQDQDGHLYVLGRREGMIKRAGVAIASRSIEEAAEQAGAVAATAALSLWPADAEGTDTIILVAEVRMTDGSPEMPLSELADQLATNVSTRMGFAPGQIILTLPESIPRTASGKVQYGRLRELIVNGDLHARNRILLSRAGK